MKRLVQILILGLSLLAVTASAQVTDINNGINKAGRQRMLSQRMAKAYLAIGMGVDVERSRKVLDASIALFDRQQVELKAYAPTAEIKDVYTRVEPLWSQYKELLVGTAPSKENAVRLLATDAQLLDLVNMGTLLLQQHSGKNQGKLVNIAGRQRMLSQRTAKFYLAQAWGVSVPTLAADMAKAREEFNAAHKELRASKENSRAINDDLDLAQSQWAFLEHAVTVRADGAERLKQAGNVATSSERVLEQMDRITGLYETLGT